MREDFESVLKAGTAELAAHTRPRLAEAVRERGDRLRRRRQAAAAAAALALAAAIGGAAFAATTLDDRRAGPAFRPPAPSATPTGARVLPQPEAVQSELKSGLARKLPPGWSISDYPAAPSVVVTEPGVNSWVIGPSTGGTPDPCLKSGTGCQTVTLPDGLKGWAYYTADLHYSNLVARTPSGLTIGLSSATDLAPARGGKPLPAAQLAEFASDPSVLAAMEQVAMAAEQHRRQLVAIQSELGSALSGHLPAGWSIAGDTSAAPSTVLKRPDGKVVLVGPVPGGTRQCPASSAACQAVTLPDGSKGFAYTVANGHYSELKVRTPSGQDLALGSSSGPPFGDTPLTPAQLADFAADPGVLQVLKRFSSLQP